MVRKVISVIIALIMLVTTSGFTISSHSCGGKRVKTAVSIMGNSDVSCGMESKSHNCDAEDQMAPNCCRDEFQKVQITQNYTHQLSKVEFSSDFAVTLVAVLYDLSPDFTKLTSLFKEYSPPPLVRNIPVLVQSFLI